MRATGAHRKGEEQLADMRAMQFVRAESWSHLKAYRVADDAAADGSVGKALRDEVVSRARLLDRERELRERLLMRLAVDTNRHRLRRRLPPVIVLGLAPQEAGQRTAAP